MPLNEFWHGDLRLFEGYQKAYYRNVSLTAWYNGRYVFESVNKAIYNGFGRQKKTDQPEQYENWKDPMEQFDRRVVPKEEVEELYRKQQADQMNWLFHR